MMRLKATKTSLYRLVREFEVLPPMGRTEFVKANRSRSWWLKWSSGDEFCTAYFSTCGGAALLAVTREDLLEWKETSRQVFRLQVDKLREIGMIEDVPEKAVAS